MFEDEHLLEGGRCGSASHCETLSIAVASLSHQIILSQPPIAFTCSISLSAVFPLRTSPPCRKCNIGGSQKEKETNQGFHEFFLVSTLLLQTHVQEPLTQNVLQPGQPRCAQETLAEVERQVKAACLGVAQTVKDLQTNSGVKDVFTQHWIDELIERSRAMQKSQPQRPIAEIQDELMLWNSEKKAAVYNPFLTLIGEDVLHNSAVLHIYFISTGFNVSSDTPVEILHTILLGFVKYVWYLLFS